MRLEQTTSGQARGLHGDASRSNAHGYRFGCALEQPAAWSWCLRIVHVAHDAVLGIPRGRSRLQGMQHSKRAQQKRTPMKYKAAVVIQTSAGPALVSVSRQHARSLLCRLSPSTMMILKRSNSITYCMSCPVHTGSSLRCITYPTVNHTT